MKTIRALWGQRMKWQVGTVEDLLVFGVNRLTFLDWRQQLAGLLAATVRVSWLLFTLLAVLGRGYHLHLFWALTPLLFVANDVKQSLRVPHRDRRDVVLAALLVPQEVFAWVRAGWFLRSWFDVLAGKLLHKKRVDRWAMQYVAEGG